MKMADIKCLFFIALPYFDSYLLFLFLLKGKLQSPFFWYKIELPAPKITTAAQLHKYMLKILCTGGFYEKSIGFIVSRA